MTETGTSKKSGNKLSKAAGWLGGVIILLVIVYQARVAVVRPLPYHPVSEHAGVLVLAHRGGRGLWPENTQYAFRHALALGADALDFDIHGLKDGTLVVLHDDTVDRTTDGSGKVRDLTLTELRKLDAGYRWSADGGSSYPYRGQGLTIPVLEEVFDEFPRVRMNIEIKDPGAGIRDSFCGLIRTRSLEQLVVVAAFSTDVIKGFRAACPGVATAAATGEALPYYLLHMAHLDRVYHPASETLQMPGFRGGNQLLGSRFISAAHAHNMEVYAWTINETEQMQALVGAGVDGIITDYPDRLLEVLGRGSRK